MVALRNQRSVPVTSIFSGRLAGTVRCLLTGVTAAAELRLGLLAGEMVDAYVDERALATVIARYRLRESQEPKVIMRVVPSFMPSWPPSHVAPGAAVALDLIEEDDSAWVPRSG